MTSDISADTFYKLRIRYRKIQSIRINEHTFRKRWIYAESRGEKAGSRWTIDGLRHERAVLCEHPRAAVTGIEVLEAGGNAADACVAMSAVMAVLAPMMTGMGGDAFLLFYEARTGRVLGANGSGRSPAEATIERVMARGFPEMPERGGLTVTVPGAVRLWEDAVQRLGRMPLSRVLEAARRCAREGYPVAEVVARYWADSVVILKRNEAAARCFLPEKRSPRAGEVFRQPDLACTLEAVMEGGAEAFYGGEIAASLVHAARAAGGYLSEEDLAAHETAWVEPIFTDYRGIRVYEIPPPGQGIAALEMLNILEGFDMAALDPSSAERIHLEAEAKKLACADLLSMIGDPEFAEVPTWELLSKEHAARLRGDIKPGRAAGIFDPGFEGDTTYLCAVDAEGNACSFINSLYAGFGSGIVGERTGVCLQNRGTSFRLDPAHPNALAPCKRPMHTIIPGLATDAQSGELWAAFGVMGGPMQPQGHAQLLSNLIDHEMSPQSAVDYPRHFHDGGVLLVEGRIPEMEVEKLRRWGHLVERGPDYAIQTGGAQLIRVLENGVRACGSDPRKDGCALAQ